MHVLNMLKGQVFPNIRLEPVIIDTLLNIPREIFLPATLKDLAYNELDIRINENKCMFRSLITSKLIANIDIKAGNSVIIFDNDFGYTAALLTELFETVIICESDSEVQDEINQNLTSLNINNWAFISDIDGLSNEFENVVHPMAISEENSDLKEQLIRVACKNANIVFNQQSYIGLSTKSIIKKNDNYLQIDIL